MCAVSVAKNFFACMVLEMCSANALLNEFYKIVGRGISINGR